MVAALASSAAGAGMVGALHAKVPWCAKARACFDIGGRACKAR
jgi:hypothetical protein